MNEFTNTITNITIETISRIVISLVSIYYVYTDITNDLLVSVGMSVLFVLWIFQGIGVMHWLSVTIKE